MDYTEGSLERRLLDDDAAALGRVIRWVSATLTSPRFWSLREEWPDLQQEVLLRVVESLRRERFDASRDFRVYVQGVARFTALQAISRQAQLRSVSVASDQPSEGRPDAEDVLSGRQRVRRVLDLASEECRELIRQYFFAGLSYSEIATASDLPVGTVKSRLFRCLESAHQALAGRSAERSRRSPE